MLDLDDSGERGNQAIAEIVGARRAHAIGKGKYFCKVSLVHMNAHCLESDAEIALEEQRAVCRLSAGRQPREAAQPTFARTFAYPLEYQSFKWTVC
ncbi:hypothetical protein BSFA1_47140 [Burkholderia sp. SFA1]|uniref:hypothetical protein n=1 Tax=Caballeronia sp. CLC5 TaxID=2906764 RepID=UPI001F360AB9|nr:hypothetical protein [Caballeronia sp. CLC5]MCE4574201.1 hypothetical protein [Caballeronia sp. CLC5]BBP99585.1 hypothetical protein BSFA1_47140 [Burkholderia sp. SFA1]